MSALKLRCLVEAPHVTALSIELRQRVERLESMRVDACLHHDRSSVETLDPQIRVAVCAWIDSLIEGLETELLGRAVETEAA